jgi:diguanylate cyclase (GGDEF)-like protein
MSTDSPSIPKRFIGQALSQPAPWEEGERLVFLNGLRGTLTVVGGLLLVVIIALFDYGTGPYLSFGIFYLIPVAICAWWSGFAPGIIIALGGAIAWHIVDSIENPLIPAVAGIWNGIVRFGTLVLTSSLISRLHTAVLREHLLATTDPLTGAANGRTFYAKAQLECDRTRRACRHLSIAYFDIDDFKLLNDRFGHTTGDAALKHVVKTIHLHLRSSDLLARLGGDEFALLMPETESEGAIALLNRVQTVLAQEMARNGWPITLSVGAITFASVSKDVDLMIQQVDALMYRAKKNGKGRVEHKRLEAAPSHGRPERRATARVLCHRHARVRQEGKEEDETQFAIIQNISAGGISVYLENECSKDTLLIVEPLISGRPPLLARVRNLTRDGKGWRHGCEVATPLSKEDMATWLEATPPPSKTDHPILQTHQD